MYQNLTSGEFQNQHEIFISSCNTRSATGFQARIYATAGLKELIEITEELLKMVETLGPVSEI